jgi:hypothetical protein
LLVSEFIEYDDSLSEICCYSSCIGTMCSVCYCRCYEHENTSELVAVVTTCECDLTLSTVAQFALHCSATDAITTLVVLLLSLLL